MRAESIFFAGAAVCLACLGIVAAIASEAGGDLHVGIGRLAVAWSLAAFLGLRMARLGVFVEADGVRVRNPLRTRTVPWKAVRGFTLTRSRLGDFGIAELHDGRRIRLWAIQPRNRVGAGRDRRAELAIGSLNNELQDARVRGASDAGRAQPTVPLPQSAPSAERT
jgi:hypothetical protein